MFTEGLVKVLRYNEEDSKKVQMIKTVATGLLDASVAIGVMHLVFGKNKHQEK